MDKEKFAKEASESIRLGKPLKGVDGIITPLLKKSLESSLEGELDSHLEESRFTSDNRRNGKGRKMFKALWEAMKFFLREIVIAYLNHRLYRSVNIR